MKERPGQRPHHFPRRPGRVNIRLSADEAAAIEEAAASAGMSKTAFVVAAALRQAEVEPELPRRRPAPDGAVLRTLLRQVNVLYTEAVRQGSNLNQMAHALNAGHDLRAADVVGMAARSAAVLAKLGPLADDLRNEFGFRL
jgi:hypothetical protein